MSSFDQATSRRRFLQFMAASPLFAYGGFNALAGEGPTAGTKASRPHHVGAAQDGGPDQESQGRDQRVRFRAGDAQQRAARAFRLHGLGHRR